MPMRQSVGRYFGRMSGSFLILMACIPALGGCDFMPSFEKTTPDMARNAIEVCGTAADGIA